MFDLTDKTTKAAYNDMLIIADEVMENRASLTGEKAMYYLGALVYLLVLLDRGLE